MSELLQVEISDTATPLLARLSAALAHRQPVHAVMGERVEGELKAHFAARNQEPNQRGWPKQNFWARIRNATALTSATDEGATVTIADPAINQKVYGGTIRPKEAKFLAIPARQEAYGVMPKSGLIPALRFAVLPRGGPVLIQAEHTAIKISKDRRKGREGQQRVKSLGERGGGVFYWLRRSVTQAADPRALPERGQLLTAALESAENWARRQLGGKT